MCEVWRTGASTSWQGGEIEEVENLVETFWDPLEIKLKEVSRSVIGRKIEILAKCSIAPKTPNLSLTKRFRHFRGPGEVSVKSYETPIFDQISYKT